jgi:phospholipid transport system transporter-binding protein
LSGFYEYSAGKLIFTTDLVLSSVAVLHKALSKFDLTAIEQVDLSAVKKLDSAGIALLLELKPASQPLTLVGSPSHLLTLLELYNLETQFEFSAVDC